MELTEEKRFALAAALLFRQLARAYDDAADMLIRQVQRMHDKAKALMKLRQASHLQQSAELVSTLRNVTIAYQQDGTAEQRLQNIGASLGSDPTRLLERCEEYAALASGIYLQLLPRFFRQPRNALLLLLEHIPLSSTSRDQSLEKAIAFVLAHQNARSYWINVDNQGSARVDDWSFIGEQWWSLVTGTGNRTIVPTRVHHRYLELCVISQVANELKSGDLCSPLGDKFRDYRQQRVPCDRFEREVSAYGEQTGIPTETRALVGSLQEKLISTSRNTDERFPQNESVRIENGEPILSPLSAKHEPDDLKLVETWIKERMGHVDIIDALVDTEHWLHWTRYFGPLSGHDAKVDRVRERYVLTVFCYGCNLDPTQTARDLFRPAPDVSYKHIDELFTAQVDYDLIATLIPDMMRVAVSIRTGNILPSKNCDRASGETRESLTVNRYAPAPNREHGQSGAKWASNTLTVCSEQHNGAQVVEPIAGQRDPTRMSGIADGLGHRRGICPALLARL